jgi:AmmeMemoRadiSam system protein B
MVGTLYPANAEQLSTQLAQFLLNCQDNIEQPKALIVPHAGYMYSGQVAAYAYRNLKHIAAVIRKVVLIGPSHQVQSEGIALPSADFFQTPLGEIEIDQQSLSELEELSGVEYNDSLHQLEHSLELQLPFLQLCLLNFKLIPLIVGTTSADLVAEVLEYVWGSSETLIVISTDLSHYQKYHQAKYIDLQTCQKIKTLIPEFTPKQACGCVALNGLMKAAKRHKLSAQLLDCRNSGDTIGNKNNVVGYASFILS